MHLEQVSPYCKRSALCVGVGCNPPSLSGYRERGGGGGEEISWEHLLLIKLLSWVVSSCFI